MHLPLWLSGMSVASSFEWKSGPDSPNMMSLVQLYERHDGKVSDKWESYLYLYDELFVKYRNENIRLLEIGVQNGGSLELWSRYFKNAELIVGCDINPACRALAYEDPRVKIVVGDVNLDRTRDEIKNISSDYHVVIDDGSHRSDDIVRAFTFLFERVVPGGVYIAEDLHCSYWAEWNGGLFRSASAMNFFKVLADVVNYDHWGIRASRSDLFSAFTNEYDFELIERVLAEVHSVEFLDSLCIVKKGLPGRNSLGNRIIVGSQASVFPEVFALKPRKQADAGSSVDGGPTYEQPAEGTAISPPLSREQEADQIKAASPEWPRHVQAARARRYASRLLRFGFRLIPRQWRDAVKEFGFARAPRLFRWISSVEMPRATPVLGVDQSANDMRPFLGRGKKTPPAALPCLTIQWHVQSDDMIDDLALYLEGIPVEYDLFLSVSTQAGFAHCRSKLRGLPRQRGFVIEEVVR
jgi:SAM-dependent methyltransferase